MGRRLQAPGESDGAGRDGASGGVRAVLANADHVRAAVRAAASGGGIREVVLDCETVPFIDVTAVAMLSELTTSLRRDGTRLVIARDVGQVRDMLAGPRVPEQFTSVHDAVSAVRAPAGGTAGDPEEE